MQFALNVLKFEDIRNQIIAYLQENSDFAGQFDFTSANISLIIDSMAYVTMLMSYQISSTTNNLFLDTTTIRKNAISIAKTMGYRPKRVISSKIFGKIQYVDQNTTFGELHTITIPAQSIFITNTGYQYLNLDTIKLTVSNTSTHMLESDVILTEGNVKKFTYLGNATPFQNFTISSRKVEENNFKLTVRKNTDTTGVLWGEVKDSFNLLDNLSYFVEEDIVNEGYVKVVFGNGDVTAYPNIDDIIDVDYIETNASSANNSIAIKLPSLVLTSDAMSASYNIKNFVNISSTTGKSYGGKEIESISDISKSAPQSFCAVGRVVTKNDYDSFLSRSNAIYKANTIGGDSLYPLDTTKFGNIYISCVPLLTNIFDLYNNDILYLTGLEELNLSTEIDRYRIISTQILFLKPSYVQLDITPIVEARSDLTSIDITTMKSNVVSNIYSFTQSNFNDYNTVFRSSKINSAINAVPNVISSDITSKYSFALTNESFYDPTLIENSAIYLPIKVKSKDALGNVTAYENFVKTNKEQMDVLNQTSLDYSQRTIYGQIYNPFIDRYMYNEDVVPTGGGTIEMCDLMLHSNMSLFSFYRFSDTNSTVFGIKADTSTDGNSGVDVTVTPSASPTEYDSYNVSISYGIPTKTSYNIGTVKRTKSWDNGFQGFATNESQITNASNGNFYEIASDFPLLYTSSTVTAVNVGDYIIYDTTINKWKKIYSIGTEPSDISAINDSELFSNITTDSIYAITGNTGNFQGRLVKMVGSVSTSVPVSSGDKIIFNISSTANPEYKWEKLNTRTTPTFSALANPPEKVIPFELKRVILDSGQTNFEGRTTSYFTNNDLIIYDDRLSGSPESQRWVKLGNTTVGVSGVYNDTNFINTISPTASLGCVLDNFDYNTESILNCYCVSGGEGNFGLASTTKNVKVNWLVDQLVQDLDIIVYVGIIDGSPTWNLFQPSINSLDIDGTIKSSLPIDVIYGDSFPVTETGTFNNYFQNTITAGDQIVYISNTIGTNTWIKLVLSEPTTGLNPVSASNLPGQPSVGDIYRVSNAGNFSSNPIVSPSGDSYIEGDYIVYNGSNYTKMKEYTFEYNSNIDGFGLTARNFLINTLGLNSMFKYTYNTDTKSYVVYFSDIFDDQKIGEFRYINSDISLTSLNTIGRLTFLPYVEGTLNGFYPTTPYLVKNLFDNTINKITFLPKNKVDIYGTPTQQEETNFNTNFNTIVTFKINEPVIEQ